MLPFDELFDDVVDSHEVGVRKPNPAIYQLALARLGAEAGRTAFLDDVATNVSAAEGVGMRGVLVDEDPHRRHRHRAPAGPASPTDSRTTVWRGRGRDADARRRRRPRSNASRASRERGTGGDHVVDEQHPQLPDRGCAGTERRALQPLGTRVPGLRRAVGCGTASRRHGTPSSRGDGPGQQLGLVVPALTGAGGAGGRPGDDIDRARPAARRTMSRAS